MDLKDIKEIEIMDRAAFLAEIEKRAVINSQRTVVLTVEMTKRRLNDKTPLPEGGVKSLLRNTELLLSIARSNNLPVIHCMSALRAIEVKFQESRTWKRIMTKVGSSVSPYGEVPNDYLDVQDGTAEPDFAVNVAESDFIIKTKKSFSSFYQTDLEWLLKTLKRDHVILAGLNTNADILSTAYDASNKGLGVITIKECVASIYGEDLHTLCLQQLGRCQGFVFDLNTLSKKLSA